LNHSQISFIGAGNMANALIRGLVAKGVPPQNISATDIDPLKLAELAAACGIRTGDIATVAAAADVIVLAVKPQVMAPVCEQVHALAGKADGLIISIAAGIPVVSLSRWLGEQRPIVRCMPNTPALVGQGATALYANANCTDDHRRLAADIMGAVGITCWLQAEQDIDTVTALSGSGPAYFFLMIEAMENAAIAMGLQAEVARQLAVQTALGAGALAASSDVPPAELRRRVTSPGGTTEQALLSFGRDGFDDMVARALSAAARRATELAN
jgi:pyrroline-5-carboxylate reductase